MLLERLSITMGTKNAQRSSFSARAASDRGAAVSPRRHREATHTGTVSSDHGRRIGQILTR